MNLEHNESEDGSLHSPALLVLQAARTAGRHELIDEERPSIKEEQGENTAHNRDFMA